ncbi:MAG: hypothetical protein ACRDRS_08755 [Pseudonocardiaceae bacterium]
MVEGEDEASALHTGLVAIRSAAHRVGTATPGCEADLDKVVATVRPAELDPYDDDYLPTQQSESVTVFQARVPVHDDPVPRSIG